MWTTSLDLTASSAGSPPRGVAAPCRDCRSILDRSRHTCANQGRGRRRGTIALLPAPNRASRDRAAAPARKRRQSRHSRSVARATSRPDKPGFPKARALERRSHCDCRSPTRPRCQCRGGRIWCLADTQQVRTQTAASSVGATPSPPPLVADRATDARLLLSPAERQTINAASTQPRPRPSRTLRPHPCHALGKRRPNRRQLPRTAGTACA